MPNDPQYDFILNTGNGRKLPSIGGGSRTFKFMLGLGGALVLILIIWLVLASSSGPSNGQQLANVARQQARLLQAAEIGVDKGQAQEVRNLAITTRASLVGDQGPLLAALDEQGISVSTADDPELEQQFVTAEQSNRLDEALLQYLESELTNYAQNIETAYNNTQDEALKEVLATQYRNAQLLAGESSEGTQE